MAQVTSGVRAIFSSPIIYRLFQDMMGARNIRAKFVKDFIKPIEGCSILDIGCGTADILENLPNVNYFGFDISKKYIQQAQVRFGKRGRFYCQELNQSDVEKLPRFDIVLALGLLHHLDDRPATLVLRLAHQALKPSGRLVTFDPCLDNGQNPIARFLVKHDRGQNVRSRQGYMLLAEQVFESPRVEVRHRTWVPYTHCFMECERR